MGLRVLKKLTISYLTISKNSNKRFAVVPESKENKFVKIPDYIDLDILLSSKFTRVIDNSGCFTIKNKKFQILNNNILPGSKSRNFHEQKNWYHCKTQ